MADSFVVGDVVQLRSGGERMTVEEVSGDDVSCVWFEGKGVQRQTFPAGVLKIYRPPNMSAQVIRG